MYKGLFEIQAASPIVVATRLRAKAIAIGVRQGPVARECWGRWCVVSSVDCFTVVKGFAHRFWGASLVGIAGREGKLSGVVEIEGRANGCGPKRKKIKR